MSEDLVQQLVALHGGQGICPTAEDWRAIFAIGDGPIHILNLLAFDPPDGAAAYGRYSAGVRSVFVDVGGERVFYGPVGHAFGLDAQHPWDAAILTRYPSARALADMWLDPRFVQAHTNRVDGLTRSQVLVFGA